MGWWKTVTGRIIGDAPLDVLEEHADSRQWKSTDDIPPETMNAIKEAYREGVGRTPSEAELDVLLAFHRGDSRFSVLARRRDDPGRSR